MIQNGRPLIIFVIGQNEVHILYSFSLVTHGR